MIIIFGWTKKGKRERPLLDTHCYKCNRPTTWDWYRLTEWITGFFIPVLPLKNEHFLACRNCGDQLELQKIEVSGVKKLNSLAPQASKELHDRLVQRLEVHQFTGKTDTQREFLKSRRMQ